MGEYQINLPRTDFPMRADLPKREPGIQKIWSDINLYKYFADAKGKKGKFILHDGPPYANGDIHLGQTFNKIFKDIVNKNKLLDGYAVPYVPGWDCHGLPIELNVEKKIGKANVKVPLEKFIIACREFAQLQIQSQMETFQRLGVIADWENYYASNNFQSEADIVRALAKIIANGYVARGHKPVHWCIACGSALAEAEVEYKEKTSPALDVKFAVINPQKFNVPNLSIPIWTTTPWTLPANEAVCLHPDLKYLLVHCQSRNENFLILENLLVAVMQRYGETNYRVVTKVIGKELEGIMLQHPFLTDKTVPVILGEHVTTDTGTGAVHTAPAHGQEDYKIGLQYHLPIKNPVGPDGKFLAATPLFAGLDVFAANSAVIQVLRENGKLIHEETLQHSYPHCWRHKTPLIFRATQQWFISMDKQAHSGKSLRTAANDEIEKVAWIPEQGKERIKDMVGLRPDWCISRQRLWGVPITLFVHKETGEMHAETQRLISEVIAPNIEKEGIVYWHQLDGVKFLTEHAKQGVASDYEKVTDTLDVWFDSGVTHYFVLQQRDELHVPADLYVEGIDQYRGWFQSSLLTAVALYGHAPYRTVISHGFTVDAKGYKMSKSVGNVIAPWQIIDKYGSDVLRLWVASTYIHDDLAAGDEIFARVADAYRMLRNTARFLLGNLTEFDPGKDMVAPKEMLALDRFAVATVQNLEKNCRLAYEQYEFHTACAQIQAVLSTELSSFYFSVIKDRLYTMAPKSLGRRSAQTALLHILEILVRLLAPIISFTAEEIWQEMRKISARAESVFMSRWYQEINSGDFLDSNTAIDWSSIQLVRAAVNKELEKLRVSGAIGSSLAAVVTLYCDLPILNVVQELHDELRFVLLTSAAIVKELSFAPENAINTELPGLRLEVKPSAHKKCARCWHYRNDVGMDKNYPELCGRCVENLAEKGEQRLFA